MRVENNRVYVTFKDVVDRRARVVLPTHAKVALALRAGAPWAEAAGQTLHTGQIECLTRRERLKIVHGGSGWGKSAIGGCEGLLEFLLPYTTTAIVAARFGHVDSEWKYIDKGLRKLFGDSGLRFATLRWDYKNSPNYYAFFGQAIWGSEVQGFSLDADEGRALLGRSFNRVVLGEGANVPIEILERKINRACDRSLMGQPSTFESGYITAYTTPNQDFGCSSHEWDRVLRETNGRPHRLEYGAVHFTRSVWIKEATVLENPAYSRAAFEARRRAAEKAGGASKDAFDEQYLGKRTYGAGRVYSDFRPEMMVKMPSAEELRKMRFAIGMDPGSEFGAVLIGLDRTPRLWVLGGVFTERQRLMESCRLFREEIVRILGEAFGTLEYKDLVQVIYAGFIDPAAQMKLEVNDYMGVEMEHPSRQQGKFELIPTIDQVRNFMQNDQFRIVEGFGRIQQELQRYVWKKQKLIGVKGANVAREPIRGFDHVLDAVRYACIPLWEAGPNTDDPPILTREQAFARETSNALLEPLREMMRRAQEQGGWPC